VCVCVCVCVDICLCVCVSRDNAETEQIRKTPPSRTGQNNRVGTKQSRGE
jgi:hypothetical protein